MCGPATQADEAEQTNDALALGLDQMEVREARPAYQVDAFDAGLAPGVDRQKLNQLVDELEAEA